MSKEKATYSHGHHSSVVKSHASRTAENSAGFLLPYIKPTDSILDVGCGPGSISLDFAKLVPEGQVLGVDAVESVLEQARSLASTRGLHNIKFASVDANTLPYADGTFDVVFAHQVLQHVGDPVGILREMRRVCKPGGIVAARDAIYSSFTWFPEHPKLDAWQDLYLRQAEANGGEPDAGKVLHAWARQADFKVEHLLCSMTCWCYTNDAAVGWGQMWAERSLQSGFRKTSVEKGLASEEEVLSISHGWKEWIEKEDLLFMLPHGEILYQVPK